MVLLPKSSLIKSVILLLASQAVDIVLAEGGEGGQCVQLKNADVEKKKLSFTNVPALDPSKVAKGGMAWRASIPQLNGTQLIQKDTRLPKIPDNIYYISFATTRQAQQQYRVVERVVVGGKTNYYTFEGLISCGIRVPKIIDAKTGPTWSYALTDYEA